MNWGFKDFLNADCEKTAIVLNDIGRNTFSMKDHVGRQISTDKQRLTRLLFIDAADNIAHRPEYQEVQKKTGPRSYEMQRIKGNRFLFKKNCPLDQKDLLVQNLQTSVLTNLQTIILDKCLYVAKKDRYQT